ncbi:hypothetical protein EVAR_74459_1 [Eumeta japonica]|uniref:Uncharacterized protein n=1 Tax=Eumeta variegata TaxID=151549 RepID=A0A4C1YMS2_EUMVA|nr:hypothetical protein EVAR_74459_1 [Eumeta japonica]
MCQLDPCPVYIPASVDHLGDKQLRARSPSSRSLPGNKRRNTETRMKDTFIYINTFCDREQNCSAGKYVSRNCGLRLPQQWNTVHFRTAVCASRYQTSNLAGVKKKDSRTAIDTCHQ